jgi:hypothetical protein
MKISFSPQTREDAVVLEITPGGRLRINGELYNFDPLGDGDTIEAGVIPCDWIIGPVHRVDGEVQLTVLLPVPFGCRDEWMNFPEPITVTEPGIVPIPTPSQETADVDA